VLPKSVGFSFILSANRLSLLPITWPGLAGGVLIKPSLGFVITNAGVLSPVIYNCRISLCLARR
jgi:hypothetical protein